MYRKPNMRSMSVPLTVAKAKEVHRSKAKTSAAGSVSVSMRFIMLGHAHVWVKSIGHLTINWRGLGKKMCNR
jgi:hypothetical protein